MTPSRRTRLLRRILQTTSSPDALESAASSVADAAEMAAGLPVNSDAVAEMSERLDLLVQMHRNAEIDDTQMLAAAMQVTAACHATTYLRHVLSPQEAAAARQRALDALAPPLTREDIDTLAAV